MSDDIFVIEDGVLISCKYNFAHQLIATAEGKYLSDSDLTSVTIPDGVTKIGSNVFWYCSQLTSVTIPDSVTEIGDGAFLMCSNLTSVTIPDSVTTIGDGAFQGCVGLADEDGFVIIRDVLYSCHSDSSIAVIPDGVKKIENKAFIGCDNLSRVYLPESLTEFNENAFWGGSIAVADDNGFDIRDGILCYYGGDAGEVVIPDGVTKIGNAAFSSREESLHSVKVITAIKGGIRDTSGITSVTIPEGVTEIGKCAFYGCAGLTHVNIPDSVENIGACAFHGCAGLADENGFVIIRGVLYSYHGCGGRVVIPYGVHTIGERAFFGCKQITELVIPDTVTGIGKNAFFGCKGLAGTKIPDGVKMLSDGSVFSNAAYRNDRWSNEYIGLARDDFFLIENGVLCCYIGDGGEVVIPDGVTEISRGAFSVHDVYIESTIGIPYRYYCTEKTCIIQKNGEVVIIDHEKEEIYGTLHGYDEQVYIKIINIDGDISAKPDESLEYRGNIRSIVIPEGVKKIGPYAFAWCGGLTDIVIPESVEKIDFNAFYGCKSLKNITLPRSLRTISTGVFYDCEGLADADGFVIVRNVLYSYHGCGGDVVIPHGVKTLSVCAFRSNGDITSVTIPQGVTGISEDAFAYCSSLTNVVIPDSMRRIGRYAFYSCYSLKDIVIPEGVTKIARNAFDGCDGITIHGKAGSFAEEYAKKKGIPFKEI